MEIVQKRTCFDQKTEFYVLKELKALDDKRFHSVTYGRKGGGVGDQTPMKINDIVLLVDKCNILTQ